MTMDNNTVHCRFEDFCKLLTSKLLMQLSQIGDTTIVEGASQNASCFFWPGGDKDQDHKQYQLQEFRTSIPLQKAQAQTRSLVPITEADANAEYTGAHNSEVAGFNHSQPIAMPSESASQKNLDGITVEDARNAN